MIGSLLGREEEEKMRREEEDQEEEDNEVEDCVALNPWINKFYNLNLLEGARSLGGGLHKLWKDWTLNPVLGRRGDLTLWGALKGWGGGRGAWTMIGEGHL